MKLYRAGIRPYYVDILKNKNERAMLSKLRISAHKLAIEGGRYLNIPKHERICTACNSGKVEDEEHFVDTWTFLSMSEFVLHVIQVK